MLTPFFMNNHNLTNININNCAWGDEGGRLFALALGSSTNKSLQTLDFQGNNITEEGMVDVITALSMFPNMETLDLDENGLRKNGCVALATLLRCSTTELQYLHLPNNEINDEGIDTLVPSLTNYNSLRVLDLSNSHSITTRGWQSFAAILEASNSDLAELYISRNNIDEEVVAAFASALMNNHTLHTLDIGNNPSITAVGWQSFSNLLCDTTSVNSTFLSNHTLYCLGKIYSMCKYKLDRLIVELFE